MGGRRKLKRMDEKEYNEIIENIEKEEDYEWEEGILYRKKEGKRL